MDRDIEDRFERLYRAIERVKTTTWPISPEKRDKLFWKVYRCSSKLERVYVDKEIWRREDDKEVREREYKEVRILLEDAVDCLSPRLNKGDARLEVLKNGLKEFEELPARLAKLHQREPAVA